MAVVTRMIPPTPTPRGRVSNMFPGVKRSTISVKLARKSAWSVSDLVNAANFLDATPDELMNDAFMNEIGMKKHQDRQGVPVGAGTPLYPVRPKAGNNGTASAGVALPRPFVAMVPPVGLEPMTIGQTDEPGPVIPDPAYLLLLYVMTITVCMRISHKA